jgi:thiamine biosynthesis lipoprotein ApbE
MAADAWATVFMAMAPPEALALAAQRGVPALLIQRRGRTFIQDSSPAWTDPAPR